MRERARKHDTALRPGRRESGAERGEERPAQERRRERHGHLGAGNGQLRLAEGPGAERSGAGRRGERRLLGQTLTLDKHGVKGTGSRAGTNARSAPLR